MSIDEFIIGLMRQGYNIEPNQLGFIPAPKVRDYYVVNGWYVLQTDRRGRQMGYILHGHPRPGYILTIPQAIIDIDHRNRGFGELALLQVINRAKQANCRAIKLRCAADLEANDFWRQWFHIVNTELPGNKRQRAIHTYMIDLWPRLLG